MNVLTNLKSALLSMILMSVLAGASYVIGLGDVFLVDFKNLTNVLVISLLTGVVSFIKSSLTNEGGVFAGSVKVK